VSAPNRARRLDEQSLGPLDGDPDDWRYVGEDVPYERAPLAALRQARRLAG
jgi:hypothetical protein